MIKNILKTALSVGGNMLFPGAGSLAGSLVDAAVPSDTQPSGEAQAKQGTDWGQIGGAAFGVAGGIAGSLLNKTGTDPMQEQIRLQAMKKAQEANMQRKQQIQSSLGGLYGQK